jgi:hypothetical protein
MALLKASTFPVGLAQFEETRRDSKRSGVRPVRLQLVSKEVVDSGISLLLKIGNTELSRAFEWSA